MIKRFNPDFSLSISHELAYMRETPEGGYVAHGDYATLFSELESVKAERDALERQLLISEAKCKGYFSDAATALIKCDALAVENAVLKSAVTAKAYIDFIKSNGWNAGAKTINGKFAGFMDPEVDFGSMTFEHAKKLIDAVETPATDAALAAIREKYRAEGINFAANRLLAAFEHGFIDKPAGEVSDVAKMILSAVTELPGAPEEDFTRDYSDEVIALIRDELREAK